MTKLTEPGLYIAITPRVIAIVKVIGESPCLIIKSAVDLKDYWKNEHVGLSLAEEISYLKSLIGKPELVLIPVATEEDLKLFKEHCSMPKPVIEFSEEETTKWRELYKLYTENGTSMTELLNVIMFDGPYTYKQAEMIYNYIVKKYSNE